MNPKKLASAEPAIKCVLEHAGAEKHRQVIWYVILSRFEWISRRKAAHG
jgi:hypothetical protein